MKNVLTEEERQIIEAQKLVRESIDSVQKGEKCYSLSESKELIDKMIQSKSHI